MCSVWLGGSITVVLEASDATGPGNLTGAMPATYQIVRCMRACSRVVASMTAPSPRNGNACTVRWHGWG